jgi:hypothetical protein
LSPAVTGFRYQVSPAVDAFSTLARLPGRLIDPEFDDEEWRSAVLRDTTMLAGYWWGLPSRAAIVAAEGVHDMLEGRTSDPKRLFWRERRN